MKLKSGMTVIVKPSVSSLASCPRDKKKLKAGMTVIVKIDNMEYSFLLVHIGGDGKERLSLEAPLARLLGGMAVGDWAWWRADVPDGELMRVELVEVKNG